MDELPSTAFAIPPKSLMLKLGVRPCVCGPLTKGSSPLLGKLMENEFSVFTPALVCVCLVSLLFPKHKKLFGQVDAA